MSPDPYPGADRPLPSEEEREAPVWGDLPRPTLPSDWDRDGNAFALLGKARKAQRSAGWTEEAMKAWHDEATAGDYDHLLQAILVAHDQPGDSAGWDEYDEDDEEDE